MSRYIIVFLLLALGLMPNAYSQSENNDLQNSIRLFRLALEMLQPKSPSS